MFSIQIGAGILPPILIGIVAYVTYVVVVVLCVDVWISPPPNQPQRLGSAIAVLVFFCLFLVLMAISFFRCLYHAYLDPGIIAMGSSIDPETQTSSPIERIRGLPRKIHAAPSLESFHDQMFYQCDEYGKPLWCDRCKHRKPNRVHHSRMLDRCILKFDHYCPWVGGYTTATNFKFFLQFSLSAAIFSLITLISITIPWNHGRFDGHDVTTHLGLTVGFAVFFMCLAGGTGLSAFLLATANLTTIDNATGKKRTWRLAVRVPPEAKESSPHIRKFSTAQHVFAIITTSASGNPYDIGLLKNWKQVMGPHVWDWVLPIGLPHYDIESKMMEITPAVAAAIDEAGLGDMTDEMRQRWKGTQVRQMNFWQLGAAAGAPLKTLKTWKQARRERHGKARHTDDTEVL